MKSIFILKNTITSDIIQQYIVVFIGVSELALILLYVLQNLKKKTSKILAMTFLSGFMIYRSDIFDHQE